MSSYKKVGVLIKQAYNETSGNTGYSESIIGMYGTAFSGNINSPTIAYRGFSSNNNGITFGNGNFIYNGGQGTSAQWAIPIAVYGIN